MPGSIREREQMLLSLSSWRPRQKSREAVLLQVPLHVVAFVQQRQRRRMLWIGTERCVTVHRRFDEQTLLKLGLRREVERPCHGRIQASCLFEIRKGRWQIIEPEFRPAADHPSLGEHGIKQNELRSVTHGLSELLQPQHDPGLPPPNLDILRVQRQSLLQIVCGPDKVAKLEPRLATLNPFVRPEAIMLNARIEVAYATSIVFEPESGAGAQEVHVGVIRVPLHHLGAVRGRALVILDHEFGLGPIAPSLRAPAVEGDRVGAIDDCPLVVLQFQLCRAR
mmetsp:Transcript_81740/g.236166  ORF Transcript_81740/g.236166 Transcript_81740/m.236166 type:complete len:280 (+) Transcript_81740:175-1014(+)